MCLITTQQEAFISAEDMTVYKSMYHYLGRIRAIHREFYYDIGKLYETEIKEVEKSYHRLAADEVDEKTLSRLEEYSGWELGYRGGKPIQNIRYIGQGFHSALRESRARELGSDSYANFIYRCTIPEGSEYFLNPSGLVVSNKLIINELIGEEDKH